MLLGALAGSQSCSQVYKCGQRWIWGKRLLRVFQWPRLVGVTRLCCSVYNLPLRVALLVPTLESCKSYCYFPATQPLYLPEAPPTHLSRGPISFGVLSKGKDSGLSSYTTLNCHLSCQGS